MLCDSDCDKRASSGEFMTLLGFAPHRNCKSLSPFYELSGALLIKKSEQKMS
jgi:hypothetical protein